MEGKMEMEGRGGEEEGVLSSLAWLSLALTWLFVFLLSPW